MASDVVASDQMQFAVKQFIDLCNNNLSSLTNISANPPSSSSSSSSAAAAAAAAATSSGSFCPALQPQPPKRRNVTARTALKFLYARKFDVVRAVALYEQHHQIRVREGLYHIDPYLEPLHAELQTGKFTILPSRDSNGAAIALFTANKHCPLSVSHTTTLQGIVYQLDSALQDIDTQKAGLIFIYDMSGSKYSNFDYDLSQKILTLLKGAYPARLKKVLIVTAPLWFKAPFKILRLFVREKLRERVFTVSVPTLSLHVPRKALPLHLGGALDIDHGAWLAECHKSMTSREDEYFIGGGGDGSGGGGGGDNILENVGCCLMQSGTATVSIGDNSEKTINAKQTAAVDANGLIVIDGNKILVDDCDRLNSINEATTNTVVVLGNGGNLYNHNGNQFVSPHLHLHHHNLNHNRNHYPQHHPPSSANQSVQHNHSNNNHSVVDEVAVAATADSNCIDNLVPPLLTNGDSISGSSSTNSTNSNSSSSSSSSRSSSSSSSGSNSRNSNRLTGGKGIGNSLPIDTEANLDNCGRKTEGIEEAELITIDGEGNHEEGGSGSGVKVDSVEDNNSGSGSGGSSGGGTTNSSSSLQARLADFWTENPPSSASSGFSDDDSLAGQEGDPKTIEQIVALVKQLGRDGLVNEYSDIRSRAPEGTFQHARNSNNLSKNRYTDVLCYDHSRVVLSKLGNDDSSDYINANFVDGYKQKNAYISTQGPLPKTFIDFWRMIWEQHCLVIVMTTRVTEQARTKCGQYWEPSENGVLKFGDFVVHTHKIKTHEHYTVTSLELRNTKTDEVRNVSHWQFTSWPDYGVPRSAMAMIKFLEKVRLKQAEMVQALGDTWAGHARGPPIVVHCSAGIGRTGTFITLDICISRLEDVGTADIRGTVEKIRSQRAYSIQMPEQYVFCHLALIEYAVTHNLLKEVHLPELELTYQE